MIVHIMSKEIPKDSEIYTSLCGHFSRPTSICIALNRARNSWIEFHVSYPTCEACILLHFANPENTADVDSYDKLCDRKIAYRLR